MSTFTFRRAGRLAAGIALTSALVAAPSALAAPGDVDGEIDPGALTTVTPTIAPFTDTLTGVAHDKATDIGAWSVTDARGSEVGYTVTVSATAPTINGVAADAGTGATVSLETPAAPTSAEGLVAGPEVSGSGMRLLDADAETIATAQIENGMGQWDFAADTGNLVLRIPGDAKPGTYLSTLTFTTGVLL